MFLEAARTERHNSLRSFSAGGKKQRTTRPSRLRSFRVAREDPIYIPGEERQNKIKARDKPLQMVKNCRTTTTTPLMDTCVPIAKTSQPAFGSHGDRSSGGGALPSGRIDSTRHSTLAALTTAERRGV